MIQRAYPFYFLPGGGGYVRPRGYTSLTAGHNPGGVVVVIVRWLDLQIPMQPLPITTKVVSSNPTHGEVYSMQHYVIKFVNDLRQVGGFLWVLWFPPPIKLTATISKVVVSTIALTIITSKGTYGRESFIGQFNFSSK